MGAPMGPWRARGWNSSKHGQARGWRGQARGWQPVGSPPASDSDETRGLRPLECYWEPIAMARRPRPYCEARDLVDCLVTL